MSADGSAFAVLASWVMLRDTDGNRIELRDVGLRYRLGTSAGTATAEAEVSVTVEAVLALNGRAIDAPLAQAAVQISGAASAAATTDAQGAWQAQVRVSELVLRRCNGASQRGHSCGSSVMSQARPQLWHRHRLSSLAVGGRFIECPRGHGYRGRQS